MESEVAPQTEAGRCERTDELSDQRGAYRLRWWDTLELQMPKLRRDSYFPSWLEPRRRAEQAFAAVVAEASMQGVST
jgi:putative transposase